MDLQRTEVHGSDGGVIGGHRIECQSECEKTRIYLDYDGFSRPLLPRSKSHDSTGTLEKVRTTR